jgi:hypothetical protein
MKVFEKDQYKTLEEYLKKIDVKLNEYEKGKIEDWIYYEGSIIIFESENDAQEYLKEYTINNWMLQYFRTEFLVENVKTPFDAIDQDALTLIIKAIQEKDDENTTNALLQLVDIDELIYNAISLDGIGHLLNRYDGVEIEVKSNTPEEWVIITCV